MKIIVSRYNEDIEWTKQFGDKVIIYNKGPDEIPGAIPLPNVGREGHTYFHYICENYDNLDDYTVFLQGRPFDHSPQVCELLHNQIHNPIHIDFSYFNTRVFECNLIYGCRWHPGLPIKEVYEKLFHKEVTNKTFVFGPGAQFIVSRERIHRRPREFYQKIVDLLGYHIGPDEGYVIERFQPLIFGDE
jgi:hypothetical protein